MNIAIFSPSQNPYSETFIQAHKQYLKGNVFYFYGEGNQVQLEKHPKLATINQIRLLKLYVKLLKKPINYIWESIILKALKKYEIDVILVEYGTHAHHLRQVLKASGLPIVVHFHGYDASVNHVVESCNNYKEVFGIAKKIVAVSKVMEQALLKLGCPKNKVVYNVYGPQPMFETVKPTFSKNQFVAIGRFTDKKAPYYTILAFMKVLDKYPNATLLMAGDGVLMGTCKNLIRYFKLENNIKLIGVVTPEVFMGLLKESLAVVQHSVTAADGDMEGTPLAVLEASVAGLPVISTHHAGIPDVVVNGETGYLVQEHDVDAMADKMMLLLNNKSLAKTLGMQGKQYIKNNFSLKRHISSLDNLMEQIV